MAYMRRRRPATHRLRSKDCSPADVELLNEAWPAAQVESLIATLDLAFPFDYLLAESWERLRRAFYFLDNLNAGAEIVRSFAAAAMTLDHAMTLKELLRSKFGEETWLTLSAEIQDLLRERKRDALAAYLLSQPQPDDAPERQVGKHQRPLRLLSPRRGDERLHAHQPAGTRLRFGTTVCTALFHGAGTESSGAGGRRRQRLALVEMDAQVPGLGGESQGLLLAGELDRA